MTDKDLLVPTEGSESAEPAKRSALRNGAEWVGVIAGAVLLAVVFNTFLLQAFYIPSPSMEPTLVKDDRILVNKIGNRFSDPGRGQIIVFDRPANATAPPDAPKQLVKRVVGLPGDTVEFDDGVVLIDGDPLDEPYLPEGTPTNPRGLGAGPFMLGDDEYFMLGDNRLDSEDSRAWGPLSRDEVVGRAIVQFWPLGDFEIF